MINQKHFKISPKFTFCYLIWFLRKNPLTVSCITYLPYTHPLTWVESRGPVECLLWFQYTLWPATNSHRYIGITQTILVHINGIEASVSTLWIHICNFTCWKTMTKVTYLSFKIEENLATMKDWLKTFWLICIYLPKSNK